MFPLLRVRDPRLFRRVTDLSRGSVVKRIFAEDALVRTVHSQQPKSHGLFSKGPKSVCGLAEDDLVVIRDEGNVPDSHHFDSLSITSDDIDSAGSLQVCRKSRNDKVVLFRDCAGDAVPRLHGVLPDVQAVVAKPIEECVADYHPHKPLSRNAADGFNQSDQALQVAAALSATKQVLLDRFFRLGLELLEPVLCKNVC